MLKSFPQTSYGAFKIIYFPPVSIIWFSRGCLFWLAGVEEEAFHLWQGGLEIGFELTLQSKARGYQTSLSRLDLTANNQNLIQPNAKASYPLSPNSPQGYQRLNHLFLRSSPYSPFFKQLWAMQGKELQVQKSLLVHEKTILNFPLKYLFVQFLFNSSCVVPGLAGKISPFNRLCLRYSSVKFLWDPHGTVLTQHSRKRADPPHRCWQQDWTKTWYSIDTASFNRSQLKQQ